MTEAEESGGPDEGNTGCNCSKHHSGVRTGIKDWCCCCDPCRYVIPRDRSPINTERQCCRCVPKLILVRFQGTNDNDCCASDADFMMAEVYNDEGPHEGGMKAIIRYQGTILKTHAVTVYMSNRYVYDDSSDPYEEYPDEIVGCRWTIRIPSLGIDEVVEVDHIDVTCLGVPAITIENVPGFNGCIGTVSLTNFVVDKIPFQKRELPWGGYPEDELSLAIPDDPDGVQFVMGDCERLPRYLCVAGLRHGGNEDPYEWAEFSWDESFLSSFNYDLNLSIIGRWTFGAKDGTTESLMLIKDHDTDTDYVQPDFFEPWGNVQHPSPNERYDRIDWTELDPECNPCRVKLLAIQPIPGGKPMSIDIRSGRCNAWDYLCGMCRCVPQNLCGFAFIDGNYYQNISFAWDNETKCWVGSGGEGIEEDGGYAMPESFNLCLGTSASGGCEISLEGHPDAGTVGYECENSMVAGQFTEWDSETGSHFSLNFYTNLTGDCSGAIRCEGVTACVENCGSAPRVLNLSLHAYSDAALGEPYWNLGPDYDKEVKLYYWQMTEQDGGIPKIWCGYRGYMSIYCPGSIGGPYQLVTVDYNYIDNVDGVSVRLKMERPDYSGFFEVDMPWPTCEPYDTSVVNADMSVGGNGVDLFWGCFGDIFFHVDVEVTE